MIGPVQPDGRRASSASPPTPRWSPACPTCTAPPWARAACSSTRRTLDRHDRLGELPAAGEEDRRHPAAGHRARARTPASATCSATTRRAPAGACSGSATRWPARRCPPPTYDELTGARPRPRRPAPAGCSSRPWLTGRTQPGRRPRRRGPASTTSRSPPRRPTWPAPSSRASPTTCAGCSRRADHFAGRRLDPLRVVGGGAQSDLWCQIVADVCDRTVERVADPLLAGLRGAALAAGLALGDVAPRPAARPGPRRRPSSAPSRPTARSTTAPSPSSRLYRSQRPMFRRLNRPR